MSPAATLGQTTPGEPPAAVRPVGAWPDQPRAAARRPGCPCPGSAAAFPSGRAALVACLRLVGVGRDSRVATPECVTGCVDASVQGCARPVPLRAALEPGSAAVSAAIVYEQWGWPLPPAAAAALGDRLAGAALILDRVDSADVFGAVRGYATFEVASLSKVLGLAAGGMARSGSSGAFVDFEAAHLACFGDAPTTSRTDLLAHPAVRERFKQSRQVHPGVVAWLAANCVVEAAEAERQARSTAARLLLDTPVANGWPGWMAAALERGAGPVWAPVLRGGSPTVHWRAVRLLARDWSLAASVRMFNWSGNPVSPDYAPAVALPIHSGVARLPDIVSALSDATG